MKMRLIQNSVFILLVATIACFILGCRSSLEQPVSETIQIPTAINPEGMGSREELTEPLHTSTPTSEPLNQPGDVIQPSPTVDTEIESDSDDSSDNFGNESHTQQELFYRVVFVESGDTLNVRVGPGVAYAPVGELEPETTGVRVTGKGESVGNSLWLPIDASGTRGWVNSRYLTLDIPADDFCSDDEAVKFVEKVLSALANENGKLLAEMIPDYRALRIRRHWWNNEVAIESEEAAELFDKAETIDWGTADGSGSPIEGSFTDIITPLIKRNLTPSNMLDCNHISHGGTAGLIRLPESYEGINYYSSYRSPGPEDFELDWGTWVIGVEKWQGEYSLSYLVHYEWEI